MHAHALTLTVSLPLLDSSLPFEDNGWRCSWLSFVLCSIITWAQASFRECVEHFSNDERHCGVDLKAISSRGCGCGCLYCLGWLPKQPNRPRFVLSSSKIFSIPAATKINADGSVQGLLLEPHVYPQAKGTAIGTLAPEDQTATQKRL